ncbi:hypothetical protein PoB_002129100 [Plakobranchus ocellatus]|uniref:Uncharacterized protein n=1 Tax=Plakobranchus ocellatus TaxID=259542 RepID=A0AAV3ZFW3_9GAST|nr:hypothetical protein PoB_002129100 [Plakobranchus ocellatus]
MSKENWINEKCKEIEQLRKHAPQTMYRNIEEITGKRTFLSTRCIKAMNGDMIIDKEKILERWADYIRELFKDDRKDHNIMKNNFAGPPIMKEEVETAIKKMKHGKATGTGNISKITGQNYKETSRHLSGPRDEKRKTGTTGKFEGKRSRGRQREKIMDGLATWLGPGKVSDILAAVKDRDLWRDMIANAYKQGT